MNLTSFRKLALLVLTVSAFSTAHAQIEWGLKGGLNVSNLLTKQPNIIYLPNGNEGSVRNFPRGNFHAGGFVTLPVKGRWSLQPELLWSEQGSLANSSNTSYYSQDNFNFNYVTVPVMLKYSWPIGIYAETGPQFGYLMTAKVRETIVGRVKPVVYDVKKDYKTTDYGWGLGIGYLSPFNLGLDIRYTQNFNDINQAPIGATVSSPGQSSRTMKNGVFQLGIFYVFGKSKYVQQKKSAEDKDKL